MNSRGALLETSIKRRLVDTQKHLRTLQHACSKFGEDFEPVLFEKAWLSPNDDERLIAYAVQAGYENTINGVIKIAQELCELEGWTPRNQEATSTEALKKLHENGLIDGKTHTSLRRAYEARGDLQHDYVNVAVREMHDVAVATIGAAPIALQDIALYMRQR